MDKSEYPEHFLDFLEFLREKYHVDKRQLFVEYSSRPPPPVKGPRFGYYEGLLSFREREGTTEFLITVFKVSREPLLTLAHEFAHLVKNIEAGTFDKRLRPPIDETERALDEQALHDLQEFQRLGRSRSP